MKYLQSLTLLLFVMLYLNLMSYTSCFGSNLTPQIKTTNSPRYRQGSPLGKRHGQDKGSEILLTRLLQGLGDKDAKHCRIIKLQCSQFNAVKAARKNYSLMIIQQTRLSSPNNGLKKLPKDKLEAMKNKFKQEFMSNTLKDFLKGCIYLNNSIAGKKIRLALKTLNNNKYALYTQKKIKQFLNKMKKVGKKSQKKTNKKISPKVRAKQRINAITKSKKVSKKDAKKANKTVKKAIKLSKGLILIKKGKHLEKKCNNGNAKACKASKIMKKKQKKVIKTMAKNQKKLKKALVILKKQCAFKGKNCQRARRFAKLVKKIAKIVIKARKFTSLGKLANSFVTFVLSLQPSKQMKSETKNLVKEAKKSKKGKTSKK